MPPTNPLHGVPRFSAQAGRLTRRSGFLVDKWPTYFGPGHRQNVTASYYPPTDWPPAGSLLRPPQTVWLNAYLNHGDEPAEFKMVWQYYYDFDPDGTQYATGLPSRIAFFDHSYFPPKPYYYGKGPYGSVAQNADRAEHDRLMDAFAQAKDQIESLRPGRTWVEIMDWNDFFGTNFTDGFRSDGFLQIAAPPFDTSPGDFYGTDFFNVWAGLGLVDAEGLRIVFNPYTPESPMSGDPYYGTPRSRLVASYDGFRRHATRLYYPDPTWIVATDAPSEQKPHIIALGPPDTPEAQGYFDQGYRSGYTDYLATEPLIQQNANALFGLMASDLADFGFEASGATSALTASSIVGLIADRFGFDPDTGKDL
jgi:hypothetical protein